MKASRLYALALLGCITFSAGCASSSPLVRGQSPGAQSQTAQNQGIQQASFGYLAARMDHGTEVSVYHQQSQDPQYGAACPACPSGAGYGGNCEQGGCDGMLIKTPWHPTHHHSFSYEQPKNLRYPTNQPGSQVRYPYYTFKGPDCFFHQ